MSERLTARERLARLLSVIPWVTEQAAGAHIDDIVERYAYPREQLLADLQDIVFFVGVHPFTPDCLIEVELSNDRVHIRYADWFSRPLRLSVEDQTRLLTAGRSVLALTEHEGSDEEALDSILEGGLRGARGSNRGHEEKTERGSDHGPVSIERWSLFMSWICPVW